MSDTPRTDAIMANFMISICADTREQSMAHREEARRETEAMERELAAANAMIAELKSKYATHHQEADRMTAEAVNNSARIAELEMFLESETLRADAYMEGLDIERASLAAAKERIAELENHLSPKPIDDDGHAFPSFIHPEHTDHKPGMSLRYWLAGIAMQGLLASGHFTTPETNEENQAWMKTHEDPWDDETGERLEFPAIKFDFPEAAFRCADSMLEYGKEEA